MKLLGLAVVSLWACAMAEVVHIDDLNNDHERRNLGHPSMLKFRLRHAGGNMDLNLEKNNRLNANAPIFVSRKSTDGLQKITKVADTASKISHYQDKRNGAFMSLDCQPGPHGPCTRSLTGNLVMEGKEYTLKPVVDFSGPYHAGAPHHLVEITAPKLRSNVNGHTSTLSINHDIADVPQEVIEEEELEKEERRSELIDSLMTRLKKLRQKRQTGDPVAHGVELLLAVEHPIYERIAAIANNEGVNPLFAVREYMSHIVNGADLRYASIQRSDVSFYLTIAGFYISESVDKSPWMDYSNGSPDGNQGLRNMIDWRQGDLPEHDHAALITGSDWRVGGSGGVLGMAYLNGVCQSWRVSINKDISFFGSSGILAHEVGHNLGSNHDGSGDSSSCDPNSEYIMQPYIPSLGSSSTTINPWRFSSCSINSFISYVNSLGASSCTLDRASIYDETEFNLHTSGLAGQIYSENEQCEILRGKGYVACTGNLNTATVCRNLQCKIGTGSCNSRYIAAHGTPCGSGMICFEGLCVEDKTNTTTQAPPATTSNPPATTSNPPATTSNPPATTSNPPATSTTKPSTTGFTTESSTSFSSTQGTTTPGADAWACYDQVQCDSLFDWLGKWKTCRFRTYECCDTCTTKACPNERAIKDGQDSYTCDQVEEWYGYDFTCSFFTWECCKRCGNSQKK